MRTLLISLLFFPVLLNAQPAVEIFTQEAEFDDVTISPNGTYLAYIENEDGQNYLSVIRTDDRSPVSRTSFGEEMKISSYAWANDGRLLVTASPGFFGGGPMATGQVFAMDADGENFEVLLGLARNTGTSRISQSDRPAGGRIVDLMPDNPDMIIVQDAPFGFGPRTPRNQAYSVDINTTRLRKIIGSPVANGNFITNSEHEITYVSGFNQDGVQVLYGLNQDDEWELLATNNDEDWFVPVMPYGDDGKMLVSTTGENSTSGYSVWDPQSNSVSPLFHHDVADVSGLEIDEDSQVWAIDYHDHYPEYAYINTEHPYAQLHIGLRRALSAFDVKIVDATQDFSKAILFVTSPENPGEYLLMDTKQTQYLMRMATRTDFPVDQMGRMDPFELSARDGTMLRGYLTLPTNGEERDLPMIVMPHDGPHNTYDTWRYIPVVQILASHGYAVLQINYRGSGGRGEPFMEAGYGEWGGVMQDDIIDAVRWAIADGVADQDRICIGGSGFGGYAALTAAFQEAELFQCAIGISGIYDLSLVADAAADMEGPVMDPGLSQLLENLDNNESLIDSRSPVANAEDISAEIMLVHDRVSFIAPMDHAERMKEALESAGKDVTWVVASSATESVMAPENQANVYQQMLDFIEENIGD